MYSFCVYCILAIFVRFRSQPSLSKSIYECHLLYFTKSMSYTIHLESRFYFLLLKIDISFMLFHGTYTSFPFRSAVKFYSRAAFSYHYIPSTLFSFMRTLTDDLHCKSRFSIFWELLLSNKQICKRIGRNSGQHSM